LSIGNAIVGTNYPDTGEPFVIGIGEVGCMLMSNLTQTTTDTFAMSVLGEIIIELDKKYIPNIFAKNTDIDYINSINEMQTEELNGSVIVCSMQTGQGGYVSFQNLTGMTKIDWGDGTINNKLSHHYEPNQFVSCKIYGVTSIGERAFDGRLELTSVEIPDSVNSIGEDAFRYCTSLTSVEIGSSVTSIKNSAFNSCTGLTNVVISNNVTSIESSAFYSCTSLTSVEYKGTTADWEKIAKTDGWYGKSSIKKVVCSDGDIEL
jgi:hypothetical protein